MSAYIRQAAADRLSDLAWLAKLFALIVAIASALIAAGVFAFVRAGG